MKKSNKNASVTVLMVVFVLLGLARPIPTYAKTTMVSQNDRMVPIISILKVPTPFALPAGSGAVTYDYTVTNLGSRALVDVTVVDDKCSPVTFLSGDVNNDTKLDVNEEWKYQCLTTLSETTMNAAIATGYSDDPNHDATVDTAVATVSVGSPGSSDSGLLPPLIDIIKIPSELRPLPVGGGGITYTYTVINPGVVPIHDVIVTDDTCDTPIGPSGDTNGDKLLDPSETWTYTCQTTISVSTSNAATAQGTANDFTVYGYTFATVIVSTAPNARVSHTVFPTPDSTGSLPNGPWDIIMLSGALILVLILLVTFLRKHKTDLDR